MLKQPLQYPRTLLMKEGGGGGGALAANVKPVMETVGFIPGSWEGLFGQGHNRSELVRYYWEKASVCFYYYYYYHYFLHLSLQKTRTETEAAIFHEEVTCWVNADEVCVCLGGGGSSLRTGNPALPG